MYEAHFGLRHPPFGLTPDTRFYFAEASHQEALNTLLVALRSGEGFLKVTGEVGLGKTLLCRQLLNALAAPEFVTAYVPNPTVSPRGLLQTIAEELGCGVDEAATPEHVLKGINRKLLENAQRQVRTTLIIDEAQALSAETLEAVRLLTNLETETRKLLQVVLFGQPELDARLERENLRQLRQRITFSYRLQPLTRAQFDAYVRHRCEIAGAATALFSEPALKVLYRASRGTPRLANILCHKALLAAFGPGHASVGQQAAYDAIYDTEGTELPMTSKLLLFTQDNLGLVCLALVLSLAIAYVLSAGLASWLGAVL